MSEPPLTTCGVCGGPLRKVFLPATILFKGSGFYSTDNRSKPKTSTSAPPGSSEPSTPAEPSSSPEGKKGTAEKPKQPPRKDGPPARSAKEPA